MLKGVGLHTGRPCHIVFKPAPAGSGIQFIRTDLPEQPVFPALVDYVVDVIRGTTLGSGEARIYTVEHVLSAIQGLQIDNLRIELNDNEPPVVDGSALPFVKVLKQAGLVEQEAEKQWLNIENPVEYRANQTVIRIEPAPEFEVNCEIEYDHPLVKSQRFVFKAGDDYAKEIAPARTFCFDYEIEALRKAGLAKGGSFDNAIVIGPAGIYNPGDSLRFKDEFVRHKILDFLGDLMLVGFPVRARLIAKRCGHGHNTKFLKQLLEESRQAPPLPIG